jgi:acyl phosphate:glycerol-3-phosphate acyltransferase
MYFLYLFIAAYFVGSIPFAYIFARIKGIDIRNVGSGNIGATNLSRALGKKWGYLCFFLDLLKGLLPAIAASSLLPNPPTPLLLFAALAVGVAAISGHIFPVFLKFKGGKGVATSFGVALGFWPYYTISALIAFVVWLIVVLLFRYISLASIIAAVSFPLVLILEIIIAPFWTFINLWPLLIMAVAIPLMVIIRHRSNINRLSTGTENKISLDLHRSARNVK